MADGDNKMKYILLSLSLMLAGTLCFTEGPTGLDDPSEECVPDIGTLCLEPSPQKSLDGIAKKVKANDLLVLANKVKEAAKGDQACSRAEDVVKCVRLWFIGIDLSVKDYEFLANDPDVGAETLTKSFEPLVQAARLNAWAGSHVVVAIGSLAWKRKSEEVYGAAVDALSEILWSARPTRGTFHYSLPAVRAADFLAFFAQRQPVSEELKKRIKRNLLWTAVHDASMEIYRAARDGADSLEPGLGAKVDQKRKELDRRTLP